MRISGLEVQNTKKEDGTLGEHPRLQQQPEKKWE
jgi:hypothetical protein